MYWMLLCERLVADLEPLGLPVAPNKGDGQEFFWKTKIKIKSHNRSIKLSCLTVSFQLFNGYLNSSLHNKKSQKQQK